MPGGLYGFYGMSAAFGDANAFAERTADSMS